MDVPENAPQHCPGTQSNEAGKSSACAGCPNQQLCSSGASKVPDQDIPLIRERLANVKKRILVLSGKGGVGKSTITSQIALALAADQTTQVAVLDIDLCGPSLPRIFGVTDAVIHRSGSGITPVFVADNLSLISVAFLLPGPDSAVIWRGPKKNGMIKQFLRDVEWDEADYMIIDTPPGTSDEHLSIVQLIGPASIDGAIIVTTPQEVALLDVRKEIDFCRRVHVPILGVVENMSGFVCPHCQKESQIFPATTGGAKKMCDDLNLQLLGSIPLDPRIAKCCDEGKSIFAELPDCPSVAALNEIAKKIQVKCSTPSKTETEMETGETV